MSLFLKRRVFISLFVTTDNDNGSTISYNLNILFSKFTKKTLIHFYQQIFSNKGSLTIFDNIFLYTCERLNVMKDHNCYVIDRQWSQSEQLFCFWPDQLAGSNR